MRDSKATISPPQGLPEAAQQWFRSMLEEYRFDHDPGGLSLLEAASWQLARMLQARESLASDGLIVKDRFDQLKEHPASSVERQAANQFRLLCRELGVSDGTDEAARIARNGSK